MTGPLLLEVGRVLKPHGLRGEVIVALVSNRTERLSAGATLIGRPSPTDAARELVVRHARPFEATGGGRWIVLFAGFRSREDAEALRALVLQAPPLDDPDALWAHELIGAEVRAVSGDPLGRVAAIEANPASDLLVLEGGGLIPLRFVVDHQAGSISVDIPPGLLDL